MSEAANNLARLLADDLKERDVEKFVRELRDIRCGIKDDSAFTEIVKQTQRYNAYDLGINMYLPQLDIVETARSTKVDVLTAGYLTGIYWRNREEILDTFVNTCPPGSESVRRPFGR